MKNCNSAQTFLEQDLSTILQGLSIVEDRVKSILAVGNELFNRCEGICALEGLANDLVVYGDPLQALCIAENIPKIYHVRVELFSKEQETDVPLRGSLRDRGYPVPKKVIFVDVKTLNPTEKAVREALGAYLDEYEIGGYCQPEAEIDEQLMF